MFYFLPIWSCLSQKISNRQFVQNQKSHLYHCLQPQQKVVIAKVIMYVIMKKNKQLDENQ